jgi:predicted MFS family arabinose efflux permease
VVVAPAARRFGSGPVLRYLAASGISLYGDWLTTVALLVLLFRATGSATAPALYMLARVAPRVVGPTPGGILTDRIGPVALAVGCLVLQGMLTAAIVVTSGAGQIWAIYPLVAGAQLINSVSRPAFSAMPPRLTDTAHLGRLNGLYAGLFASSILVSPAIGALVLPHTTPQILIAADAASFVIAAFLIATLPIRPAPRSDDEHGHGMRAGWSAIAQDATLRSAGAAAFGNAAAVTALQAVLVVAAAEHFHRDVDIGWLYAAVGAGGVLGSLLFIGPTPRRIRRSEIVLLAATEVAALAAFVFIVNLVVAAAMLFVSSLAATVYEVLAAVALQQRVPFGLLGRANGAMRVAMYSGMLVGAIAAVALVRPIGWEATVLLVCGLELVTLTAFTLTGPRDRPASAADAVQRSAVREPPLTTPMPSPATAAGGDGPPDVSTGAAAAPPVPRR